jgi:hypothetical protein
MADITAETIKTLVNLVRSRFPEWDGFRHQPFEVDEVHYKQAAMAQASEWLGKGEYKRLLQAGEHERIFEHLLKIGGATNLLFLSVPLEGDMAALHRSREDKPAFCTAMYDLIHGDGESPARLDRFIEYIKAHNLRNRWTFPTYYLFMFHPETDLFVKPRASQAFLSLLDPEYKLPREPSGEEYARILGMAGQLREAMSEYGARDMLDIQSLGWVCAHEMKTPSRLISRSMLDRLEQLFGEFLESYPSTEAGIAHGELYRSSREEARRNYETILAAKQRGGDVTDLVLLKLLPHADTQPNREHGAWIPIAPARAQDVKALFQRSPVLQGLPDGHANSDPQRPSP